MKRLILIAALALPFSIQTTVHAQEMMPKADDRVTLDLAVEDWVTTKTAHVAVNVEAAVSASNAGTLRNEMFKAVNDLAKADWRLTAFNRSEDQTGLERWSASFEARVPEANLSGLAETAKKLSKAGMQLSIGDIDFTPTLDEMETTRGGLRTQIYKQANDQLAALNAAMPGRNFRISMINFGGAEPPAPMPQVIRGRVMNMAMASAAEPPAAMAPMPPSGIERSEKVTLTARVVLAATADRGASSPPPVPPAGPITTDSAKH